MRASILLLLSACTSTTLVRGVDAGPDSVLGYVVIDVSADGRPDVTDDARAAGTALSLGRGRYVAPAHCFPADARAVFADGVFAEVRVLARGPWPGPGGPVVDDWCVFEISARAGDPPRAARNLSLSPGDVAVVLPGVALRVLSASRLELERGPSRPGWSGRPVAVDGVAIGIVQGADDDRLYVTPLPPEALLASEGPLESAPRAPRE